MATQRAQGRSPWPWGLALHTRPGVSARAALRSARKDPDSTAQRGGPTDPLRHAVGAEVRRRRVSGGGQPHSGARGSSSHLSESSQGRARQAQGHRMFTQRIKQAPKGNGTTTLGTGSRPRTARRPAEQSRRPSTRPTPESRAGRGRQRGPSGVPGRTQPPAGGLTVCWAPRGTGRAASTRETDDLSQGRSHRTDGRPTRRVLVPRACV